MCACDLEPCPACAEREAAEWEPDAVPLDPEYLALFYGDEGPTGLAAFYSARQA